MSFIRTFLWSFIVTALGLAGALIFGDFKILVLVVILSILEISFSFDNAVINATILRRMSRFWQTIFLTVGIAIAVFGMRLVFPLLLVTFTAGINPVEALDLAITDPARYQHLLEDAHPAIAAFGGVFLLMIFLDFVFEERELRWLKPIETGLIKIGKLDQLSVVIALAAIAVAAETLAPEPATVLVSGVLGLLTYLLVNGLGELFESSGIQEIGEDPESTVEEPAAKAEVTPAAANRQVVVVAGKAAFFLFLYLEVLDASFSFDGVIGAFAITSDIFVIALGLGIGAMYVRSITIYLVNRGTLDQYVYLEHGAHWAIGALAVILLISMKVHIDEVITGLIGVVFIVASVFSSVRRNRRLARGGRDATDSDRQLAQV